MPRRNREPLSYIVRIYRRDRAAREITGIVEFPEQNTRLAFRNFAELKALLTRGPAGTERGGDPG